MRILLVARAFNRLTQRLWVELERRGHAVSLELDVNDGVIGEAVALFRPDLVIVSYLTRALPEAITRRVRCLVVHPGPPGDRGPSSLDRAILEAVPSWGVTLLEADAELDAGPVWASRTFPMRAATKSSLYRNEVTDAALACVLEALDRIADPGFRPRRHTGPFRPLLPAEARRIDWRAIRPSWSCARSARPTARPVSMTTSRVCRCGCSTPTSRVRCGAPPER